MIYYAIADLHGRYDLLQQALTAIGNDAVENNITDSKIITLGDYIDRGPDSNLIIQHLMALQDDDFISFKGNHEDMMLQATSNHRLLDWWYSNGGWATVNSYGYLTDIPTEHLMWMATLPLYYETEKHVFVHAGVPADDLPLDKQDPEELMWMLYGKNDAGWYKDKHVVHGHHQFVDGPHEWQGRTDLDTFAWKSGRLVVGVFSDEQYKALRFLEVRGDGDGATRREDLNDRLLLDA